MTPFTLSILLLTISWKKSITFILAFWDSWLPHSDKQEKWHVQHVGKDGMYPAGQKSFRKLHAAYAQAWGTRPRRDLGLTTDMSDLFSFSPYVVWSLCCIHDSHPSPSLSPWSKSVRLRGWDLHCRNLPGIGNGMRGKAVSELIWLWGMRSELGPVFHW